ncbi:MULTISPECIES: hypothetical protein [unclassified Roseateles]|uniref:hypothetical protein n=1 Tax=unclassified Roseateles TaxID=2626991 RepID=UPI0006FC641E|nr:MULTISPECIES: hypothetical protein [unclassified Roseateles]KQW49642.1 hypothetical protein ASC81_25455 [Pelomonas sp. Root405]KRA76101.1 hypothetical protein ASD88_25405 [Pelomonas sp. Root662]
MSSIPQASTQALTWHYLAGPARLCISAGEFTPGDLPPCAAEAAVVLDLAGELLDGLAAAGLLGDVPWQWVAATGGMITGGAQASWRGAEAEARLSLPWAALRALAAPPEVPGLQWQATPAECLMAQWRLGDEELAALEPGGLLLLEEPVRPEPRARGESAAGDKPWQLVARWEQPLTLDVVMGWCGPVPVPPPHCQLIDAARPDAVRARGRLVPWGTGQAFRIDAI